MVNPEPSSRSRAPVQPDAGRTVLTEVGTRDRLLDAAMACFLEIGFSATSMDMVRQRAAVSNGSLYHHFPTKQALADALYEQVLRERHAVLHLALVGHAPTTRARAQATVRALVRTYLEWVTNFPNRARLLAECKRADHLMGSPDDAQQAQQAHQGGLGALAGFIAQGVAAGHLQDLSTNVWTALVLGPALQLTPGWLAQGAKTGKVQITLAARRVLQEAAWGAVQMPVSNTEDATPQRSRVAASEGEVTPSPQLSLFATMTPEPMKSPHTAPRRFRVKS